MVERFENETKAIKYHMCNTCLRVKLTMKMSRKASIPTCFNCYQTKKERDHFLHPIWFNDQGTPMYEVPEELFQLTEGEKLLIQQVSPYVPLQHLQNGSYGAKGHVCAFPQDIHEICTKLCIFGHFKIKIDSFLSREMSSPKNQYHAKPTKIVDSYEKAWHQENFQMLFAF